MAITFRRMDLPTLRWTLRSSCKSRIRLLIDSLWPLAALTRLRIIADKHIRLQALLWIYGHSHMSYRQAVSCESCI